MGTHQADLSDGAITGIVLAVFFAVGIMAIAEIHFQRAVRVFQSIKVG